MELPSGTFCNRFEESFLFTSLKEVKTGIGVDDTASWNMSGDMPSYFFFISEKDGQNTTSFVKCRNFAVYYNCFGNANSPLTFCILAQFINRWQLCNFCCGYFKQTCKKYQQGTRCCKHWVLLVCGAKIFIYFGKPIALPFLRKKEAFFFTPIYIGVYATLRIGYPVQFLRIEVEKKAFFVTHKKAFFFRMCTFTEWRLVFLAVDLL